MRLTENSPVFFMKSNLTEIKSFLVFLKFLFKATPQFQIYHIYVKPSFYDQFFRAVVIIISDSFCYLFGLFVYFVCVKACSSNVRKERKCFFLTLITNVRPFFTMFCFPLIFLFKKREILILIHNQIKQQPKDLYFFFALLAC